MNKRRGTPIKFETWNSDSDIFEKLIKEYKPKKIVEIGSWHGGSAIKMAQFAPKAEIICIDTWLGSSDYYLEKAHEFNIPMRDGYPQVYDIFRQNTKKYENIKPIPLPSHEARHLIDTADLIYVDGSHDFEAVYQDLKDYHEKAPVLFGDDYTNPDYEVGKAVDKFAKEQGYTVEVYDNWYWIIKK